MFTYSMCLCATFLVAVTGGNVQTASVFCKNRTCQLRNGEIDWNATAYGRYNDSLVETGWGHLDIRAGYGNYAADDDVMYAAGYLEGALTYKRIFENYINVKQVFFDPIPPATVAAAKKFLFSQDQWSREMVTQYSKSDSFWRQVGHVTAQLDGLYSGYNSAIKKEEEKLEFFIFQALSGSGDLSDIMTAVNTSLIPDWKTMSRDELDRFLFLSSRCSAIVKVADDLSDIFMGHSTWFLYQSMMRIYKYWDFKLYDMATVSRRMSFSSYPGFLVSIDDFYILPDTSMVMLQTTNDIFNQSLYKLIQPFSLLAWQRVRVANMAASSGKEWADNFRRYNSGTYQNQYMLIDLKKLYPGLEMHDGLLWVVEQIPGLIEAADQTHILWEGYWPSYNIPFYESIYNTSGYPEFVALHGKDYSYLLAPRAKIFRRDHGNVQDISTLQHILRYNDYKHDEFSEGNPCYSICCRGDLMKTPMAGGCIDTKVTDFNLARANTAWIISGPTRGDNLPIFRWTDQFKNVSHVGLPEQYDFNFYRTSSSFNATF